MSQFYLHHIIEPKVVQPWKSDLWDIIIIHRVLIGIAGLRVVAPEVIQLGMFAAIHNSLKVITADIGNAYLHAKARYVDDILVFSKDPMKIIECL